MERPQVRGYSRPSHNLEARDFATIISKVPPLTQMGAVCLICGKFVGLLAVPAVFIPALNSLAIFLVCSWGGLVFCAIALCSYEHFREKKVSDNQEKMALISELLHENPGLRHQLKDELEEEEQRRYQLDEPCETSRVIRLYQQR
ncbi:MAG: hypothetical protein JXR89_06095 [Deltaproteobacteria bacterium]|nr:hypothetical protein [Deltaproteobacteria bacterium]